MRNNNLLPCGLTFIFIVLLVLEIGPLAVCQGHYLYYVTESMYYLCARTNKLALFFRKSKLDSICLSRWLVYTIATYQQKSYLLFKLFHSISRFIYPGLVSLFIATLYFPPGLGQYLVSTLSTQQQIMSLFSNFTWMSDDLNIEQAQIVSNWTNGHSNPFVTLAIYMVSTVSVNILFLNLIAILTYLLFCGSFS